MDRIAYFAEIAGGQRNPWINTGVFMLVGTLVGGLSSGSRQPAREARDTQGAPDLDGHALDDGVRGGAIMAYGARMARGCTSGQALSGGAVLSVGSWAFMFCIFGAGYAVAWFFRRFWT